MVKSRKFTANRGILSVDPVAMFNVSWYTLASLHAITGPVPSVTRCMLLQEIKEKTFIFICAAKRVNFPDTNKFEFNVGRNNHSTSIAYGKAWIR